MNLMRMKKKEEENKQYKLCPQGHKNSPTAKNCWVCGEPMDAPKSTFIQKTNTVVSIAPQTPSNYVDVNYAEEECQRYVPGRKRCDERDSSTVPCAFMTMGCAIREKRFRLKPGIDVETTTP